LELIKQHATREQAQDFLRSRHIPHTGTWQEILDKRFLPALNSARLTPEDLVHFLRATEEYGRQHIFLYRCSRQKATQLMDRARIRQELAPRGAEEVLANPRILEMPSSPTIVDARWDDEEAGARFILKFVETRHIRVFSGEERHGDNLTRTFRMEPMRAVNLFSLGADGLLEMRIQSHKNSTRYDDDVARMWRLATRLLPSGDFSDYPIVDAKNVIWKNRHELANEIRYNDSTLRNDLGTVLTAATGREATNLVEDPGADSGLETFFEHGGYCDELNVWFRGHGDEPGPGPQHDLHVLFSKEINEFVVTAQCSRADYEYALGRIRELNS
jgi:hypothetical protein